LFHHHLLQVVFHPISQPISILSFSVNSFIQPFTMKHVCKQMTIQASVWRKAGLAGFHCRQVAPPAD